MSLYVPVFRINAANTGQFERTLIVAEDDAYVSYLEGCTAPQYDKNQVGLFPSAPGNLSPPRLLLLTHISDS